ncbi:hypothetical protein EAS64_09135 [Trebonia kvetii]|uniref:Mechanosensitive ion channel MscS domain-containing protein n=1 Tax=Trebonia kvetii TaxID=2480626 RepID=A0A6P2C2V3_9ACTN|nr:mechanosensitive ion channel domain-containing protein [Trebonia kvetii]TVZ04806.1 hypothetical protein EAS64_09135 [Trebonia kvetii]
MQVHGGPPIDLSAQVAKVRAKTRPWKSIIALIFAIGAAVTAGWAHKHFFATDPSLSWVITAVTAIAFCVFASAATIGLSGKARSVLEPVMGTAHAAIVRYALVLIGAVTTLIVTLVLFGVPVGQLLLGGALTSVFVGIAAQQALSNVFAGIVLLLARPFKVGDAVRLRAGALSGEVDGTVSEIGITYVRLSTVNGMLSVPNSQVLNAVIGPLPPQGSQPPITPDPWPQAAVAPGPPLAGPPQASPSPADSSRTDPWQLSRAQAGQAAAAPAQPAQSVPAAAQLAPAAAQPAQAAAQRGPSADGASAGPVGTADGAGGAHRPGGTGGEQ